MSRKRMRRRRRRRRIARIIGGRMRRKRRRRRRRRIKRKWRTMKKKRRNYSQEVKMVNYQMKIKRNPKSHIITTLGIDYKMIVSILNSIYVCFFPTNRRLFVSFSFFFPLPFLPPSLFPPSTQKKKRYAVFLNFIYQDRNCPFILSLSIFYTYQLIHVSYSHFFYPQFHRLFGCCYQFEPPRRTEPPASIWDNLAQIFSFLNQFHFH